MTLRSVYSLRKSEESENNEELMGPVCGDVCVLLMNSLEQEFWEWKGWLAEPAHLKDL